MARHRPDGIEVVEVEDGLIVRRRWRQPDTYAWAFLGMFAVWHAVMLVAALFAEGARAADDILGHIGIAVAGLGFAYWAFATFFNTTEVRLGTERFEVQHGPFPWPGGGSWSVADVEQFLARELPRHLRPNSPRKYVLEVGLPGGRSFRWVRIASSTNRRQIERLRVVFEAALGIEDRPVRGEG